MTKFNTLWKNFPQKAPIEKKCRNRQKTSDTSFENYCAILLSECFIRSGIDISHLKADKCWSHSGKKHIIRAEEMANALKSNTPNGFTKAIKVNPGSFQTLLKDKTGVIYFKDYWQRDKETFHNRSGDHIDLWNKDEITSSSMFTRSILEFLGRVSDLNKSKEIWFWEVK